MVAGKPSQMGLTMNANLMSSSLRPFQGVSSRKWMDWVLYTLKSSRLRRSTVNDVVASAVHRLLPIEGWGDCMANRFGCLEAMSSKECRSELGWRSGRVGDMKLHKTP